MSPASGRSAWGLLGALALVLGAFAVRTFVGGPVRVGSVGMSPRLCPGDVVWVGREGADAANAGAVVAWRPPGEASIRLDRVVGTAGASIEVSGGVLRVDGAARTTRPYGATMEAWEGALVPIAPGPDLGAVKVSDGHVFLLSDNRRAGGDSQAWGQVGREHVVGAVQHVLWTRARGPQASRCGTGHGLMR